MITLARREYAEKRIVRLRERLALAEEALSLCSEGERSAYVVSLAKIKISCKNSIARWEKILNEE